MIIKVALSEQVVRSFDTTVFKNGGGNCTRAVERPFFGAPPADVGCFGPTAFWPAAGSQRLEGISTGQAPCCPHVAPLTRTRLSSRLLDRWL